MALVFGSINVDEFFSVPHIVRPGETLASTSITKKAGGKGANTAVALAKASAKVALAGQIGEDGEWIRRLLQSYAVNTTLLKTNTALPSGRATIQISREGENSILLFGGTNQLRYSDTLPLDRYTHLLLQEEIVHAETIAALTDAHARGLKTVYNPSPMPTAEQVCGFPWESLSYLIVNKGEAETLLRVVGGEAGDTAEQLLNALMQHPSTGALEGLIITLGEKGLVARIKIDNEPHDYILPSTQVDAVDTTGAGDTFAGYFLAALMALTVVDGSTVELALKNAMGVGIALW